MTVTPLEIARFYAAIANGGYLLTPRLVRDAIDDGPPERRVPAAASLSDSGRVEGLHAATLEAVREGLRRVVEDERGTAHQARLTSVAIAGKTGTAETGGTLGDHAWFAGYAPAERRAWHSSWCSSTLEPRAPRQQRWPRSSSSAYANWATSDIRGRPKNRPPRARVEARFCQAFWAGQQAGK